MKKRLIVSLTSQTILQSSSLNLCDEIRNFTTLEQRVEALESKRPQTMSASVETTPEVVLNNPKEQLSGQTIFGKLLVELRKQNEMMLIALLGEHTDFTFENNVLTLTSHNEQEYKTLLKLDNINVLNKTLDSIQSGAKINVVYTQEKKAPTVEDLLREKFGDDIKIKE